MNLTPGEHQLFTAAADFLIPANEGMPSASQAGVDGAGLIEVFKARPELESILVSVLRQNVGKGAAEFLKHLKGSDPATFGAFAEAVAGAYFMNTEVRTSLGYFGQKPLPINEMDVVDPDLLKPVIDRGAIYRSIRSETLPPTD